MTADQVTRVSRRSWGRRVKSSFGGIVVGLLLLATALLVLFTNEGRAVRRHKALAQGARDVVSVTPGAVDPAREGRLVHLSGPAQTRETLTDPDFGVSARAIHLEREVEMYQWLESASSKTEKKLGGSTETTTTYTYRQGWSDRLIDSDKFEEPAGHRNPDSMPYSSRRVSAREVTLGGFRLSETLIRSLDRWTALLPTSTPTSMRGAIRGARITDGGLYVGRDPGAPQIGDLRVSFRQVEPATVTVVAGQRGNLLTSWSTRSGGSIELLRYGQQTPEEMFSAAHKANKILTWVLRIVGYFLLVFGLGLILGPLSVVADVLPALGNLVGRGSGLLAIGCALPVALVTISVAWLVYRPLIALAILLPAAILAATMLWRSRRQDPPRPVVPPPPPPPPPPPKPAPG